MKQIYFLFIALLVCGCVAKTTIVTLEIKNAGEGEFCVLSPINGRASIAALDTIRFVGDTVVFMPIKSVDGLVSMSLFGSGLRTIKTVCGDGDFTIVYNPADSVSPIRYRGDNAEGRALLQAIEATRDGYKYEWVRDFSVYPLDTIGTKMEANFRAQTANDIARFDSLLAAGKIDRQFYHYTKLDAEVYHALSMSKVLRANYHAKENDPNSMYPEYVQVWDRVYADLPVSLDTYRTGSGMMYAKVYVDGYLPFLESTKGLLPKQYRSLGEYLDDKLLIADIVFKRDDLKEIYTGSMLFEQALNNKTYDTVMVAYIDNYIASYPQSNLNDYFVNHKRQLDDYYEKLDKADMSRIHFIEDADQITTLSDLLARFKGTPVFVDFWFSTCGPCLREFEESGDLKKFLAEKDVEVLFVSVDRPQKMQTWMNAIRFNQMDGHHIRCSQALHDDIYKTHGVYLFPTYMIVDADGKILIPRAETPSSGKLIDQITTALKL